MSYGGGGGTQLSGPLLGPGTMPSGFLGEGRECLQPDYQYHKLNNLNNLIISQSAAVGVTITRSSISSVSVSTMTPLPGTRCLPVPHWGHYGQSPPDTYTGPPLSRQCHTTLLKLNTCTQNSDTNHLVSSSRIKIKCINACYFEEGFQQIMPFAPHKTV